MRMVTNILRLDKGKRTVAYILFGSAALSVLLFYFRIVFTNSFFYGFLVWNLFLAWVPLLPAYSFRYAGNNGWQDKINLMVLFGAWLIFFPNSAYIFTDFIHLRHHSALAWYDPILLSSFSIAGLIAGFVSLNLIHHRLKLMFGKAIASLSSTALLFLAAFGVFLGRVYRLNSWELLTHPFQLLRDATNPLVNSSVNKLWLVFTIAYGLFLWVTYKLVNYLMNYKLKGL